MSIVAVCTAGGTVASTTTAVLLAASVPEHLGAIVAECDPSGGDLGAWAELPVDPGWSTAIAGSQRSWAAVIHHAQALPSGLRVMTTSPRPPQARAAVIESAAGFAPVLAASSDVVAVADCGRIDLATPVWLTQAEVTVLLLRQASSAAATVARVDRTVEARERLGGVCGRVEVVLIGTSPYPPAEIEAALGTALFGVLPEDVAGAGLVCGGWTIGRRAAKSPLARAVSVLARRVLVAIGAPDAGAVTTHAADGTSPSRRAEPAPLRASR